MSCTRSLWLVPEGAGKQGPRWHRSFLSVVPCSAGPQRRDETVRSVSHLRRRLNVVLLLEEIQRGRIADLRTLPASWWRGPHLPRALSPVPTWSQPSNKHSPRTQLLRGVSGSDPCDFSEAPARLFGQDRPSAAHPPLLSLNPSLGLPCAMRHLSAQKSRRTIS